LPSAGESSNLRKAARGKIIGLSKLPGPLYKLYSPSPPQKKPFFVVWDRSRGGLFINVSGGFTLMLIMLAVILMNLHNCAYAYDSIAKYNFFNYFGKNYI